MYNPDDSLLTASQWQREAMIRAARKAQATHPADAWKEWQAARRKARVKDTLIIAAISLAMLAPTLIVCALHLLGVF